MYQINADRCVQMYSAKTSGHEQSIPDFSIENEGSVLPKTIKEEEETASDYARSAVHAPGVVAAGTAKGCSCPPEVECSSVKASKWFQKEVDRR